MRLGPGHDFLPRVSGCVEGRGGTPDLPGWSRPVWVNAGDPGPVTRFSADLPPLRLMTRLNACPAVHTAGREDGSFAVVDGEIYNWDTLGGVFESGDNDAGRLLKLYDEAGPGVFSRLDAAAGITLFDAGRRMMYIVRDAVGHTPVYYAVQGERLMWCSGLTGLLGMGVPADPDPDALDYFMTSGYIPAPWTFVAAIRKLPPGHMFTVTASGPPRLDAYWRPSSVPVLRLPRDEVTERLAALVPDALDRRYGGKPKTGLLLSGGVDSMTLGALMSESAGEPLPAFTFHYLGYEGVYNERQTAGVCADLFGMRHHVIEYGPADIVAGMQRMLAAYGEPFTYGLHTFKLGEVRDRGIDTLVCGTGADGWFPARRDKVNAVVLRLRESADCIIPAAADNLRRLDDSDFIKGRRRNLLSGMLWSATTGLPYAPGDYITPYDLRRSLYADPGLADRGTAARRVMLHRLIREFGGDDQLHRLRFLSLRLNGAEMMLNWNHHSGRAHGVTLRAPYFDRAVLDFIHHLPPLGVGKKELRRYAARVLPPRMAYGPKVPQSLPLAHWFRTSLRDYVRECLAPARIRRHGLFNPPAVQRLVDEHLLGRGDHAWTLWALLVVTGWQSMYQGGDSAAPRFQARVAQV